MTPSSALAGITVLEICNVAAGPFCGMLLADMGADVIKVENRTAATRCAAGRRSPTATARTSPRSIATSARDLESERPRGPELARELALTVDVLIENNRPGVMGPPGPGLRGIEGAQSPAGVLLDLGLRTVRPARAGRRLRPHHPGHERHHERHRRGRRRTRQMRRAAGGLLGRAVRRLRHRLAARRAGQRAGRAHRRAHAGRHAGHRRAADLRVRQRARSGQARLRPSAQRALPGVPLQGRVLRHGCRQPGAVEERVRGGWPR